MGFDLRSPLERVLEILNRLRDEVDIDETRIINDINYCIKVISSNSLYEANIDLENPEGTEGNNNKLEV